MGSISIQEGQHYSIKYLYDNISAMFCNYCNFSVTMFECGKTKTGHRWPFMVHKMKRHLRDEHGINLYKKTQSNK